jgi:hypothetical protein
MNSGKYRPIFSYTGRYQKKRFQRDTGNTGNEKNLLQVPLYIFVLATYGCNFPSKFPWVSLNMVCSCVISLQIFWNLQILLSCPITTKAKGAIFKKQKVQLRNIQNNTTSFPIHVALLFCVSQLWPPNFTSHIFFNYCKNGIISNFFLNTDLTV